jgi:hypothetical protein
MLTSEHKKSPKSTRHGQELQLRASKFACCAGTQKRKFMKKIEAGSGVEEKGSNGGRRNKEVSSGRGLVSRGRGLVSRGRGFVTRRNEEVSHQRPRHSYKHTKASASVLIGKA